MDFNKQDMSVGTQFIRQIWLDVVVKFLEFQVA